MGRCAERAAKIGGYAMRIRKITVHRCVLVLEHPCWPSGGG